MQVPFVLSWITYGSYFLYHNVDFVVIINNLFIVLEKVYIWINKNLRVIFVIDK